MKLSSLAFSCLLVILFALMTAPVSAAPSQGTTAVMGNVATYVSIIPTSNGITLNLVPEATATDATLYLDVVANNAFSITAKEDTGRTEHIGYMQQYTRTSGEWGTSVLASPITLTGTTVADTTVKSLSSPLKASGETFYEGAKPVSGTTVGSTGHLGPNTFSQPVATTDEHLTGEHDVYRTAVTFTISAS